MSYSNKRGSIRAKWLYLGKVVVFGKVVVLGLKWMYTGKSGCWPTATVTSQEVTWNDGKRLRSRNYDAYAT